MMALGCIQALKCNTNRCPVGVATTDRTLMYGLDPSDKKVRVYNLHKNLEKSVCEIIGAMGLKDTDDLQPWHLMRSVLPRSSTTEKSTSTWNQVACYSPIYPNPMLGQLPLHSPLRFSSTLNLMEPTVGILSGFGLYPCAAGSLVTTVPGDPSSLILPCDSQPTAPAGCTP